MLVCICVCVYVFVCGVNRCSLISNKCHYEYIILNKLGELCNKIEHANIHAYLGSFTHAHLSTQPCASEHTHTLPHIHVC